MTKFEVEARVTFLTSDEGGRASPAPSGYRAQFFYDGHDWDALHEYPDQAEVRPGQTARVLLSFLSPQEHHGKMCVGMPFAVREGQRTVARGEVTRLLDASFDGRPPTR